MRKSGQPAKRLEEKIYAVTKKHEADGGGRPGLAQRCACQR